MQNIQFSSYRREKSGQALMMMVFFIFFVATAAIAGFAALALTEVKTARDTLLAEKSFYVAEAGLEDVAYRIKYGKNYNFSEIVDIDGATTTVTVTAVGSARELLSTALPAGLVRKVRMVLSIGSNGSLVYGVQVGRGGIAMQNTSSIIGNVYSNGDIIGTNSPTIEGDAFAATNKKIDGVAITGSAYANVIQNLTVGKNASSTADIDDVVVAAHAYANRILDSTVTGHVYYQTSIAGTTFGGTAYPGSTPPPQLPEVEFPITDADLDGWENAAAAGGTISSPCPYEPANGTSIGPKKINCDMEVDGTKIITLTGPLWISGNLDVENSAQIKLAPSYGNATEVIIVDKQSNRTTSSKISVENSAQILGSGVSGSYVFVVSRNNSAEGGGNDDAITIKNTSNAPIYFAPHGSISIENSAALKEASAYKLKLKNSATVTYESGLANIYFSTGPTGGFSFDGWQEVE